MTGRRPPPRVAVVGSINMDLVIRAARLPAPGETVTADQVRQFPGGKGANQAVAAARLGAHVSLCGRIGDDSFGPQLRQSLETEQIDTSAVTTTSDCASGLAIVAVETGGENSITVASGANRFVTPDDVAAFEETLAAADVVLLQLEIPLDTVLAAVQLATRHEVLTILDPAPAPQDFPAGLLAVDLVCPNQSEAARLTGRPTGSLLALEDAARQLCRQGARRAVITLGKQGALLCDRAGSCRVHPGMAVRAVDTTAAGDAFAAALGVALAERQAIEQSIRFANVAGGLAASHHGAQAGMPARADVQSRLANAETATGADSAKHGYGRSPA